jgi:hypothetical protein
MECDDFQIAAQAFYSAKQANDAAEMHYNDAKSAYNRAKSAYKAAKAAYNETHLRMLCCQYHMEQVHVGCAATSKEVNDAVVEEGKKRTFERRKLHVSFNRQEYLFF